MVRCNASLPLVVLLRCRRSSSALDTFTRRSTPPSLEVRICRHFFLATSPPSPPCIGSRSCLPSVVSCVGVWEERVDQAELLVARTFCA